MKKLRTVLCLTLAFLMVFAFVIPAQAAAKTKISSVSVPASIAQGSDATISFKANAKCTASVAIYDAKGKLVAKVGSKTAAKNKTVSFKWNGKDSKGNIPAAATYKVKITAGKTTVTKTMKITKVNISSVTVPVGFYTGQQKAGFSYKVDADCKTYVQIFDSKGTLVDATGIFTAKKGKQVSLAWDGTKTVGKNREFVDEGVYTVKITAGATVATKRITAVYPDNGYVGDYYVSIDKVEKTTDNKGGNAVRVYFTFENHSDASAIFQEQIDVWVAQNGTEGKLTPAQTVTDKDLASTQSVKADGTVTCSEVFTLQDTTNPVDIEVQGEYDSYCAVLAKRMNLN